VIIGVLLLGVVAIAFSRGGGGGDDDDINATANVRIDGDELDPPIDGPDPMRGERAPELRGIDLEGRSLVIAPGRRPMAVIFLAHWCPHCQREVEAITEWLQDNEFPEGVDVFAVSTLVDRTRGNYPPKEWLDGEGWPVRTLVDDEESPAAVAYGLQSTPFWVFLDEDGKVVERTSGEMDPADLEERLADLSA
jgi:thiol-disulfide isomerase/thioredoxin